jgi:hypothetical protein
MRSRRPERAALAAALLALAARAPAQDAAPAASAPAASAPAAAASAPDAAARRAAAVAAAASALRADPLLSGHHKTHVLKWNDDEPRKKRKPSETAFGAWLRDFARFLNDTSRLLVYGLALVLVALLLVSLRHLVQLRGARLRVAHAAAVSHVRDLDVRPESLPADIGAAAWALWQAGDVAGALSLLYRGALSRLIHRFAVPIGASTTEGECLDLARGRLEPGALRYLTQLVRAWEASTYGGRSLSLAMGESLCGGFTTRLDAAPGAAEAAP